MSETLCASCGKGKGPTKCEICGFSDNGFINRQFLTPEDIQDWINTVVKPYRKRWKAESLAQLEASKKREEALPREVQVLPQPPAPVSPFKRETHSRKLPVDKPKKWSNRVIFGAITVGAIVGATIVGVIGGATSGGVIVSAIVGVIFGAIFGAIFGTTSVGAVTVGVIFGAITVGVIGGAFLGATLGGVIAVAIFGAILGAILGATISWAIVGYVKNE